MPAEDPKLEFHPLTPDRWRDFETLFGERGACGGCWCMYWRIGAAYRRRPGARNKADFREVVRQGPPPGLVAFDGELAVGWCQLTPRDALPFLDRQWRLERVDDVPVWSISCFYVRIGHRRRGVGAALIRAGEHWARARGYTELASDALLDNTVSRQAHQRLGYEEVERIVTFRKDL